MSRKLRKAIAEDTLALLESDAGLAARVERAADGSVLYAAGSGEPSRRQRAHAEAAQQKPARTQSTQRRPAPCGSARPRRWRRSTSSGAPRASRR